MAMFGQTAGTKWNKIGADYFHKVRLFDTQWPHTVPSLQPDEFSLDGLHTVCAENGGPVLLVRNDTSQTKCAKDFQKKVRILTSSGLLLSEFPWIHDDVVAFGWNHKECIVAVTKDGTVFIYNIQGKQLLETCIDAENDTDFIQIDSVHITRFGISCTFLTLPGKVAYYSFSTDITTWFHPLPPNCTVFQQHQITPSLTHIQSADYTSAQYNQDDEILLSELTNPKRYEIIPKIAVLAQVTQNSSQHSISLFTLTPRAIHETHAIIPYNQSENTTIQKMTIDSSQQFLGVLTSTNTVYCISLRTMDILYEYPCQTKRLPQNIAFCGSASLLDPNYLDETYNNLLLHWNISGQSVIMIVGNTGSFVSYTFPGPTIIQAEMDYSIRIISESACELIQCIHPDIVTTLGENSQTPATQLLSSYLQFKTNHLQSDILLRRLIDTHQLAPAVRTILSAASHLLHEPLQSLLLQTVSYARHYLSYDDDISSDEFVDVCKLSRLLFTIRDIQVGIPLTHTLLTSYYASEQLIIRITTFHQHSLAVQICNILRIPPDVVVQDWCLSKLLLDTTTTTGGLSSTIGMNQLLNTTANQKKSPLTASQQLVVSISSKLRLCRTKSYVTIALWAAKHQKDAIACALAHFEPLSTHQVALFIALGEFNTALRAAFSSNDYQLLIVTLLQLYDMIPNKLSFFQLVHSYPDVELIWIRYISKHNYDIFAEHTNSVPGFSTLKFAYNATLLLQNNDSTDQILSDFHQLVQDIKIDQKPSTAQSVTSLSQSNDIVSSGYGQQLIEHETLLNIQKKLISAEQLHANAFGLSLAETIKELYRSNHKPQINMLKDVFKLTDQRLSYIMVPILIEKGDFASLQQQSSTLQQHVGGYEYIIECLVEMKVPQQAVKYIELLPKYTAQLDWLCNLELYNEAAQVAFRAKDIDSLRQVRGMCVTQQQQAAADRLLAELQR